MTPFDPDMYNDKYRYTSKYTFIVKRNDKEKKQRERERERERESMALGS